MAKFNEHTTTQILTAMALGTGYERAAQTAGVDRSSLWRWLRRGEEDDRDGKRTKHAAFYRQFKKADAEVIGRVEQSLLMMTEIDVRAVTWFLSKRAPAQYGNQDPAVIDQIKRTAARELIDLLQYRATPGTFREVCDLLAGFGDSEVDSKALPVPD